MTHLTWIGDVWLEIQNRDFATAKRLGRAFAEDLRLLDDLGWSDTIDRESVALTLPQEELMRTVARLQADARAVATTRLATPTKGEPKWERS